MAHCVRFTWCPCFAAIQQHGAGRRSPLASRAALVGLLLLVLTGCGGGDSEPAAAPAPAPMPVAQQPAPQIAAPPPPPPPPPVKIRPADVAQWQPEDFELAKKERDGRLSEAVTKYAERTAGDPAAVDFLLEIATERPPEPTSPDQGAGGAPQFSNRLPADPTVVNAVIAGLGANGTDPADEALRKFLSGEIATGTPARGVCEAVLKSFADHWKPAYESVLVAAALEPDTVRLATPAPSKNAQPNPDDFGPDQLQQAAVTELVKFNSPELRKKLAERLAAPDAPAKAWKHLQQQFLETKLANVPAQVILFGGEKTPFTVRAQLEQLLSRYTGWTLDRLLGIPTDFHGAGAQFASLPSDTGYNANVAATGDEEQTAPTDAERAEKLAGDLWLPPLLVGLRKEMFRPGGANVKVETLLPAVVLATSLPLDESRQMFADLNDSLWRRGPEVFGQGTQFGEQFRDPATILIIKTNPRKEDPAKQSDLESRTAPRRNTRPKPNKKTDSPSADDKIRFQWMDASEQLVRHFNARFEAAARAQPVTVQPRVSAPRPAQVTGKLAAQVKKAPDEAGETNEPDRPEDRPFGNAVEPSAPAAISSEFPFPLHDDQPIAEYHLRWPANLEGKIGSATVSPLAVHYVRFEQKERPTKITAHYVKQLKTAKQRFIQNGRWIDYVGEGSGPGLLRSVDVMVTSPNQQFAPPPAAGNDAKAKNPPEDLVVEILTVEAIAPRHGQSDDKQPEAESKPKRPSKKPTKPNAA